MHSLEITYWHFFGSTWAFLHVVIELISITSTAKHKQLLVNTYTSTCNRKIKVSFQFQKKSFFNTSKPSILINLGYWAQVINYCTLYTPISFEHTLKLVVIDLNHRLIAHAYKSTVIFYKKTYMGVMLLKNFQEWIHWQIWK